MIGDGLELKGDVRMNGDTAPEAPRRIAILGSSGGNLRSHGGSDPARLISDVARQVEAAGFVLEEVQFVAAAASMDGVAQSAPAALWGLGEDGPQLLQEGPLSEINILARQNDERLAARVRAGEIDGLIVMSHDPGDTNSRTVTAAAAAEIPAAGTGGSSLAVAQQMGLRVVSASGTTGTTSSTRAVSAVSGLARHWKVSYRPRLGGSSAEGNGAETDEPAWKRISIRGIMVGSIPAFIALALLLAISKIPGLGALQGAFDLMIAGLPIIVSAIAARKISGLGEVGVVAGAIAGVLAQEGGILGGLLSGILSGLLVGPILRRCVTWSFPATTANIATGALGGLLPGLLMYFVLSPLTAVLGTWISDAIAWAVAFNPIMAGALAGLAIWPAIIGGVYHSAILPLVLLEMGQKGHSFFGAVDMAALVVVSLGITLANVIRPRTSGERALAGSGSAVNFFFGTFVESSYPFMFGDRRVFAAALLAATAGGAVVGMTGAEATAYVPVFIAPFISTSAAGLALAMLTSFAIAFTLTLFANLSALKKNQAAAA